MEKKKLKKLSINKMVDFPVIEEQEQMAMKGGDGYTLDDVSGMIGAGTWGGGYVEGVGYVAGASTVYGGNILEYANLQYSDSGNKVHYAFEALVNTGVIIYNGGIWFWNRTGAQW